MQQQITALEQAIKKAQETLQQLKSSQKLATTMDEVVEELKPKWWNCDEGDVSSQAHFARNQTITELHQKKVQAYTDVLNICAYLNGKFEGDGIGWFIDYTFEVSQHSVTVVKIYHFTSRAAAEYAKTHFAELFKTFYS